MDGWSSTATLEAGYCGSINFLQKLREYDEITRTFTSLPPHDTVNIFVRIIGSNGFGGS